MTNIERLNDIMEENCVYAVEFKGLKIGHRTGTLAFSNDTTASVTFENIGSNSQLVSANGGEPVPVEEITPELVDVFETLAGELYCNMCDSIVYTIEAAMREVLNIRE